MERIGKCRISCFLCFLPDFTQTFLKNCRNRLLLQIYKLFCKLFYKLFPGNPIRPCYTRTASEACQRPFWILKKAVLNRLCAPSGARTLDPNIKSVVLYQLS